MSGLDDGDELTDKYICCNCVGEAYLAVEIKRACEEAECAYCGGTAPALALEDLADRIESAFEDHYTRTADQPNIWQERMLADRESDYFWSREGLPVVEAIQEAAGIDLAPAADVLAILEERHSDPDPSDSGGEETEFAPDSHYDERGINDQAWQEEWRVFEHSLKTEARFFSRIAADHLARVFGGIDKLKTRDGRTLVVEAGPKTALDHLCRARVFQSEDKLKEALCRPAMQLGSPPPTVARAGRMNAQGVSVFYGATEASIAIAEVRPPVGSRVAAAKFSIARPLRLLDLTALEDVHDDGSIFDPSLKRRLERVAFLRTLGWRMSRPVMPDDEALDYLATQVVADFLATTNEPRLDGIIFPSAQSKEGRNVVLFHHAARVEAQEFPEGTKIAANTGFGSEDEWVIDYSVNEHLPPLPEPTRPDQDAGVFGLGLSYSAPPEWNDDFREVALRIDAESLKVHHVNWVEVTTQPFAVHRYRYASNETKF